MYMDFRARARTDADLCHLINTWPLRLNLTSFFFLLVGSLLNIHVGLHLGFNRDLVFLLGFLMHVPLFPEPKNIIVS